jgi:catechol 2,3-dioxygenase-like lactoylglutathione lyase family enzyme
MKYVCALIVVDDIDIAKDFYVRVLKQKIATDFGENVAFEGGFAIHQREHFQDLIENRAVAPGGNNAELYFEDDDVDAIETELRTEGVEFVHRTREQPWRQRVLRFYDRDRHIVEIGESLEFLAYRLWREGKTAEEISAITTMAPEFVKAAIASHEDR